MSFGIPHIGLSSVSGEVLRQADHTFRMSLTSDVAVAILSTLCCTIAHRFSIGDKSGLLPGLIPFAQKQERLA